MIVAEQTAQAFAAVDDAVCLADIVSNYEFHRSLESFWNQFRRGGSRFQQLPTNAEYGRALEQALRAGGYSAEEAASLAAQAGRQRAAYGLAETAQVPRIPGRINQTPPAP